MSYPLFHILHLISLFLLIGITFYCFAAPSPGMRKHYLMLTGICSLVVVISGLGLIGIKDFGFPLWVIVKILCWLILSCLAGIVFSKPEKVNALITAAIVLVVVAVTMVSVKPF